MLHIARTVILLQRADGFKDDSSFLGFYTVWTYESYDEEVSKIPIKLLS
jgi:hypothetical protein